MDIRRALGCLAAAATLCAAPSSLAGQILGRVVDEAGQGVEGAKVRVIHEQGKGLVALSDSTGIFQIDDIPAGELHLEVTGLGYSGATQTLIYDGRAVLTELVVRRDPLELPGLSVEAEVRNAYLDRTGFYHRQRTSGTGRFLDLETEPPRPTFRTAQIFQRFAGVTIRFGTEPVFTRSQRGGSTRVCAPAVFVDGMMVRRSGGHSSFQDVAPHPEAISAAELYASEAFTPPQWRWTLGRCGVIVIWTKH